GEDRRASRAGLRPCAGRRRGGPRPRPGASRARSRHGIIRPSAGPTPSPRRRRVLLSEREAMFEGFATRRLLAAERSMIHGVVGGVGPPLLLLHGYPQTHVMWHKIAPRLAEDFTVVAPDLRGYGDSDKPDGGADHAGYSKRTMASDQAEVMTALGFPEFRLVGHDRGARVAYRMALDHPDRVTQLAVLDVVPTHETWIRMDRQAELAAYRWLFLAQPFDLPERMIGANSQYFLSTMLGRWSGAGEAITSEAMAEYVRCFSHPETIHATCEDYRAGATIDFA